MSKVNNEELNDLFEIADGEEGVKVFGDKISGDNKDFSSQLSDVAEIISKTDLSKVKSLTDVTHKMVEDDIPPGVTDIPTEKKEVVLDLTLQPIIETETESEPEQTDQVVFTQVDVDIDGESDIQELPGQWLTKSPSVKFDRFYEEKIKLIKRILVGGPIPFDEYQNELKSSHVDVSVINFDSVEVYNKMSMVQGFKDRLAQIQMHCNSQIFLWERSVELMRGLLARTEYDKPVAKNDGIAYEHIHDMELYYGSLKGITKSTEAIMKTLDSAYECLSRRVTIASPSKPMERYSKPQEQSNISEFDELPHTNHGPIMVEKDSLKEIKGTRLVGYNEI